MSVVTRTKEYSIAVANASLNAFTSQVRGDLEGPSGAENVRLYTAKGGSAITTATGTTSVAVVYDPEVTLRNGQLSVDVFERNSSSTVTKVNRVTLGRASNDFLSAGVLSSGLKVFNSSGTDVIGGTQTAAVVSSIPRDISTITSTDVANFSNDHDRDLVSGVVSRDDATMTMSFSNHLGEKMALCRDNTYSNVIRRTWDDGVKDGTIDRRTTSGRSATHVVDTDLGLSDTGISDLDANNLLLLDGSAASNAKLVVDSSRLSSEYNPLTLATYSVEVSVVMDISGATLADDLDYKIDAVAMALDAAGKILATKELTDRTSVPTGGFSMLKYEAYLTSSTVPIHRVVIGARRQNANQGVELVKASSSYSVITAIEETADIPARPVHVCVFEGLNDQATLNINSFAVLTGIPDSTNVFIAPGGQDEGVHDVNAVNMFMRSMARSVPRAFTVHGHSAVESKLSAMYGDEEITLAFHAMSFDKLSKNIKTLGKLAKHTVKTLPGALKEVEDAMEAIGGAMSYMPGPVGTAGTAISNASRLLRKA